MEKIFLGFTESSLWQSLKALFMYNNQPGSLLQIMIFSIIIFGLLFIIKLIATRNIEDVKHRYHAKRIISYVFYVVYAFGVMAILLINKGGVWEKIAELIGFIGAGLAVAMHDSVSNITGWFFLIIRKPFKVGERIEIDGIIGDVIDIRLFEFSLIEVGGDRILDREQSTGRILHVPNGVVLRKHLANFDIGFSYIWNEMQIVLTFESNWKSAKKILEKVLHENVESFSKEAEKEIKRAANKYLIFPGKLTPIVYTAIEPSGVSLTMRYLIKPRQRRNVEQTIFEELLIAFEKKGNIDFAYPTVRYYDNREKIPTQENHAKK